MENYSFGTCEVCGQGLLMAVKNTINGEMLIMCDDCECSGKLLMKRSRMKMRCLNKHGPSSQPALKISKLLDWRNI